MVYCVACLKLSDLRNNLATAARNGCLVAVPAIKAWYPIDALGRPTVSAIELRDWYSLFKKEVEKAAAISVESFDRHISPQLIFCRFCIFYSPCCKPPKEYTHEDTTVELTGDGDSFGHKFVAQVTEYAEEVWRLWHGSDVNEVANRDINTAEFWTCKANEWSL